MNIVSQHKFITQKSVSGQGTGSCSTEKKKEFEFQETLLKPKKKNRVKTSLFYVFYIQYN